MVAYHYEYHILSKNAMLQQSSEASCKLYTMFTKKPKPLGLHSNIRTESIQYNNVFLSLCYCSCDLKPENIMFADNSSGEFNVKIIDFGMAVTLWDRTEHYDKRLLGTTAYLAAESIECYLATGKQEAVFSKATDIWQAGCILYTLLTCRHPFGDDNTPIPQLTESIRRGKYFSLPPYLSADARDLVQKLFCLDPTIRPTAGEILHHPWVANYAAQSDRDFGIQFKERVKKWTFRQSFKSFWTSVP